MRLSQLVINVAGRHLGLKTRYDRRRIQAKAPGGKLADMARFTPGLRHGMSKLVRDVMTSERSKLDWWLSGCELRAPQKAQNDR